MFACSGSAIALIALFSTPGFRRSSTARDAGARFEEQFAFLSTLTANSACGIVITDAEERTVYVNPVFERISGFSAEEMIGKKPGALLQGAETDAEARNRIRCSLKAGEPISVEILNYQKNGTPYWIEMFISPLFDADGKITHFVAVEHDITVRKKAEDALRQAQERLEVAQEVAHIGSWEYDLASGRITWSKQLFHILGLDPAQGEPDYDANLALYYPEDAVRLDALVRIAIAEGKAYEIDLRRSDGEGRDFRWFHAVGRPVTDDRGKVVRLFGTLQDITLRKRTEEILSSVNDQLEQQKQELQSANRALKSLATTDGLTGLHNHRAFQEKLAEEFERTQRYKMPFSVILIDVDNFKLYNDSYGHPEGDVVLKTVAQLLREQVRVTDYVCRYGGEEFVILLPGTEAHGAQEVAERLRTAIEMHPWAKRPITASFGIATLQADLTTAQELVDQADKALYTSKAMGRNCTVHYEQINASKRAARRKNVKASEGKIVKNP